MRQKNTPAPGPALLTGLTDVYLLLMLTLFPLWTGFGGYEAITQAKYHCFLALTLGYLALLALLTLELLAVGALRLPRPGAVWRMTSPAQRWAVLFALLCALSALCSPYRAQTWMGSGRYGGLFTTLLYVALFLALSALARPRRRHLCAFAAAVTLICLVSLLQVWGLNPLGLFPPGVTYQDVRVLYPEPFLGTLGNVDLLSAFLCLAIPLFTAAALVWRQWLLLAPAGLGALVLVLSGVSAGPLALAAAALVLAIVYLHISSKRWGVLAALLALGLLLLWFWPGHSGTLYEASRLLHGDVSGSFGSGRIAIWGETLSLVPERPLLGGGPDTLLWRLPFSFQRDLGGGQLYTALVDNAHNEYLDLLVNVGALGLAAYLAALCATARRWLAQRADAAALPLAAAVLCYCIQAFFCFSSCITAPLFWLAWGLLEGRGREMDRHN